MKSIWLNIVKPKGIYAKWLIFLTLAAVLVLGGTGHFDIVREYLDTEALTFQALAILQPPIGYRAGLFMMKTNGQDATVREECIIQS